MSIPKPKTVLHKRLFLNIWWQHLNIEDISIYIYVLYHFLRHLSKAAEAFSSASFVSVTVPQSQAAWDTLNCIHLATDSFEPLSQNILRSDLNVDTDTVDVCMLMYTTYIYISILGPDHERLLAWHSALRLALLNSSRRTSNIPSTPWQRYQRTTKKTKTNVSHVNKIKYM